MQFSFFLKQLQWPALFLVLQFNENGSMTAHPAVYRQSFHLFHMMKFFWQWTILPSFLWFNIREFNGSSSTFSQPFLVLSHPSFSKEFDAAV